VPRKKFDDILSRLDTIHQRDGRMDRRTPEYSKVSSTVSEIFTVEKYRDLEIGVKGHSVSLGVATFDGLCTISY